MGSAGLFVSVSHPRASGFRARSAPLRQALACLGLVLTFSASAARSPAPLPDLGAAAPFSLSTPAGQRLALEDLRGKVVLVAFIYTRCKDVCLAETAKMATVQRRLGKDFGSRVHFVSITLDPEADDGAALLAHARRFGARLDGWSFLTGTPEEVREVARRYGVVFRKTAEGEVEHNTLASIIDPRGHLRVQYLGTDFDPQEMLQDIRGLLPKGGRP